MPGALNPDELYGLGLASYDGRVASRSQGSTLELTLLVLLIALVLITLFTFVT